MTDKGATLRPGRRCRRRTRAVRRRAGRWRTGEEQAPEQLREDAAGRRKPGREAIHRAAWSRGAAPGTIMWMWGWCVRAEPHVCSTAVIPIRAPRCCGSAAIVIMGLGRRPEQQVVHRGLVVEGDVGDLGGDGEDHVEVANGGGQGRARPPLRRVPPPGGFLGERLQGRRLDGLQAGDGGCGPGAARADHAADGERARGRGRRRRRRPQLAPRAPPRRGAEGLSDRDQGPRCRWPRCSTTPPTCARSQAAAATTRWSSAATRRSPRTSHSR